MTYWCTECRAERINPYPTNVVYIYGAPCKATNFNVVYVRTSMYTFGNAESRLFLFAAQFQHWINAESYPVAQLCVNTFLATKITLITHGI
jgi:hypothetical protein